MLATLSAQVDLEEHILDATGNPRERLSISGAILTHEGETQYEALECYPTSYSSS